MNQRIMNEKRKIDVVVKYFLPVMAGIEVNTSETYRFLAQKSWDVTFHTTRDTHIQKNILPEKETIMGLKVLRYPFGIFGFFPKINWEKADLVCLHNFNVVPHFFIMLRTLLFKLLRQKKYALILTPHGGFNPEWRIFSPPVALIKKLYHFTLGVWLINRSVDGVRAVSEWERREMITRGISPHLVRTISNGVEDDAFRDIEAEASDTIRQAVASWGKYIIQIGRIYKIKNYETALRALALLDTDINYVIVGPLADVEYKKRLDSLILELGLKNRVFFPGVLRGVDKFYAIRNARLMVHMALWESFCNVVHEGMSQGLVCVVANNTALPLLVQDGISGYCIETMDFASLATRMRFILEHEESEVIQNIKAKSLEFGRQHSWKSVAENMDEFYQETLRNTESYSSRVLKV